MILGNKDNHLEGALEEPCEKVYFGVPGIAFSADTGNEIYDIQV